MFAFILSNLMGLVRQILVSRTFGTSQALDAFYAAVTFPDILFSLLAGGALASAFVPTFTEFIAKEKREDAWRLASAVTNTVILILSAASGLAALFAPVLVRDVIFVLKPELDPALQSLTVDLLRIILLAPTIFGISGLIMSILNTHQRFWLPALAPVFNWIGWIFGIIFLVPTMGIFGLAWGYVIGAVLHLFIQIPSLLQLKGRSYVPTLGLNNPAVSEVARLMAPRLLGVAAVQVNFVVNAMIASSQSEGSLSAISVARMVMTMPLFVIAQAIATAALPTFSAQVARGEIREMRSSLSATLRGVILLSLPATVGLILLREPIIAALFQRGEFNALSTEMVSWALLWYTAGLVGHSIVEILSRAFFCAPRYKDAGHRGDYCNGAKCRLQFWIRLAVQSNRLDAPRRACPRQFVCHRLGSPRPIRFDGKAVEWHGRQIHHGWNFARVRGCAGNGNRLVVLDPGYGWNEPLGCRFRRRRIGRNPLFGRSDDSARPRNPNAYGNDQ